jgi:hypothetical protein
MGNRSTSTPIAREGLWLIGSIVTAVPVAWFTLRPPLEIESTTTLVSAALWFGLLLGLATYAGLAGTRFAIRIHLRACLRTVSKLGRRGPSDDSTSAWTRDPDGALTDR